MISLGQLLLHKNGKHSSYAFSFLLLHPSFLYPLHLSLSYPTRHFLSCFTTPETYILWWIVNLSKQVRGWEGETCFFLLDISTCSTTTTTTSQQASRCFCYSWCTQPCGSSPDNRDWFTIEWQELCVGEHCRSRLFAKRHGYRHQATFGNITCFLLDSIHHTYISFQGTTTYQSPCTREAIQSKWQARRIIWWMGRVFTFTWTKVLWL